MAVGLPTSSPLRVGSSSSTVGGLKSSCRGTAAVFFALGLSIVAINLTSQILRFQDEDAASNVVDIMLPTSRSYSAGGQHNQKDRISFPGEWTIELKESLQHFESNRNESISPEGLQKAFENLRHGFFVRIENGKMYMDARKQLHTHNWQGDLENGNPPVELCGVYELVCSRGFKKDIDFVFNFADEPIGVYDAAPYPVFSWTKTNLNTDLLVPYQYSFSHLPEKQGEKECDSVGDEVEREWGQKKDMAVWRGATTGVEPFTVDNWRDQWRPKTVKYCKENEDICNARIASFVQSNFDAVAQMRQELGGEDRMAMSDQASYKYALVLDGNSAPSSRMRAHLDETSLMIKQESPFMEFFYPSLRAYYNYLPLSRSIEDLRSVIEWARKHDDDVKQMIKASRRFSCQYFRKDIVMDYIEHVFEEYAKRFEGVRAPIDTKDLTLVSFGNGKPSDKCPNLIGQESCPMFH